MFSGGNTLYYAGCLTQFGLPEVKANYEKILQKCGIDYIKLNEREMCCGSPVKKAGYFEDYEKLKEKNKKLLKEHGVKRIIFNCPTCYEMLANEYGLENEGYKLEHFSTLVYDAVKSGKLKPNGKGEGKIVTYHDPCHLGRWSGIYEQPREALRLLGYVVREMRYNRKDSFCCGGGGGVRANFKELSDSIAKKRLSMAEEAGTKVIISPCPMCSEHLRENEGVVKSMEFAKAVLEAVE